MVFAICNKIIKAKIKNLLPKVDRKCYEEHFEKYLTSHDTLFHWSVKFVVRIVVFVQALWSLLYAVFMLYRDQLAPVLSSLPSVDVPSPNFNVAHTPPSWRHPTPGAGDEHYRSPHHPYQNITRDFNIRNSSIDWRRLCSSQRLRSFASWQLCACSISTWPTSWTTKLCLLSIQKVKPQLKRFNVRRVRALTVRRATKWAVSLFILPQLSSGPPGIFTNHRIFLSISQP